MTFRYHFVTIFPIVIPKNIFQDDLMDNLEDFLFLENGT